VVDGQLVGMKRKKSFILTANEVRLAVYMVANLDPNNYVHAEARDLIYRCRLMRDGNEYTHFFIPNEDI
jgi:hypothetical protein